MTDTERRLFRMIGSRVCEIRKARSVSQEKLADWLGMSRASVVNFEGGNQAFPLETLYQIACEFEVEIADVIPTFEGFLKEMI